MMQELVRRPMICLTVLVTAAILTYPAAATPANKASLERHMGRFLPRHLRACTTCHLPSDVKEPESLEDFPHNPFGAAVATARSELKKSGKPRDIGAALARIASQDSDGDGVDNLTELLLGRNPGDAHDKPTALELKETGARREEFAAFLKSYRWEPFEPVTRPAVPVVASDSSANPIDAFVREQLTAMHLTPSPEAPKVILLRRVYLDLIGLSPTPAEIAAFEADVSTDAYEKVVDRLLADPRYGQRWGRHWMDVWRYSDWAGYAAQIRDSQPFIWRWRDWIIESLNADKGYDRMLTEMLAADEIAGDDPSALRATGFLVRDFKLLSREQWMEDTVNHTSRAFLGLTMHCAKCHDHKFDPITQEDYYRFRAVFEPYHVRTDAIPGTTDKKKDGLVRAYDKDLKAETFLFTRGDERTPDKARGPLAPGVPAALGGTLNVKPAKLPFAGYYPDRREFVRRDLMAEAERAVAEARAKLAAPPSAPQPPAAQVKLLELGVAVAQTRRDVLAAQFHVEDLELKHRQGNPDWIDAATQTVAAQRRAAVASAAQAVTTAEIACDDARRRLALVPQPTTKPADAKLLATATAAVKAADAKLAVAAKAFTDAVAALHQPPGTRYTARTMEFFPDTSSGRRLALANWLVDAKNPLTARVAVNHLWGRHFSQGIVPSVDDFGGNGRGASHPALLDWLATELINNGWRMKPIHRLIVTSRTYRQSSLPRAEGLRTDPDNTWLWRFPSRRMEAELVRDNILSVAGQLDCAEGGPEIDHTLAMSTHRRSLYLQIAPEKEGEFMRVFDGPNPAECYFRRPSVMPQQALAMANSPVVVEQARVLAKAIGEKHSTELGFIRAAFLQVLARPATDGELVDCVEFLEDSKVSYDRAREDLIVVLFNHNDFVTVR